MREQYDFSNSVPSEYSIKLAKQPDIALCLAKFSAQNPELLAETPRGTLWRVDTCNGPAVLKVVTERGIKAGELVGAEAMRLWEGNGAAKLLGLHNKAMLLEFLPGPCLGEIVRAGHHDEAAQIIATLAAELRRPLTNEIKSIGFGALQDNFDAALTKADFSTFPSPYRSIFSRARTLWHYLLDSTQEYCLLHGDLNLDNIIQSERGWLAIDPKGLIGDPCYEFAITFRTPFNTPEITVSSERIISLAEVYASHTGLDKTRIMQFGFAHVAMSLAWHLSRGNYPEADLALLKEFDCLGLISNEL